MKLIIDIPEEDYNECKFRVKYLKDLLPLDEEPTDLTFNMRMETLIANGTPLPEGHGRLIDADALDKSLEKEQEDLDLDDKLSNAFCDGLIWASEVLSKEPTIIEADKENNNG